MDIQTVEEYLNGRGLFEMTEQELKEYFDKMLSEQTIRLETALDGLKELVEGRFKSMDTALLKADEHLTARLLQMNQFRAQIEKERAQFPTRLETDALINAVRELIAKNDERGAAEIKRIDANLSALEKFNANLMGKITVLVAGSGVISGIIVGLIVVFISNLLK